MTLGLTRRDLATFTAALHAWQNELSSYTIEELRDYHPELNHHEPLTVDEVDSLLGRLQDQGRRGDRTDQEGGDA